MSGMAPREERRKGTRKEASASRDVGPVKGKHAQHISTIQPRLRGDLLIER